MQAIAPYLLVRLLLVCLLCTQQLVLIVQLVADVLDALALAQPSALRLLELAVAIATWTRGTRQRGCVKYDEELGHSFGSSSGRGRKARLEAKGKIGCNLSNICGGLLRAVQSIRSVHRSSI